MVLRGRYEELIDVMKIREAKGTSLVYPFARDRSLKKEYGI